MATCKECGKTNAEVDFYDSIKTYCKEHWREKSKARRDANIESARAYDRARGNRQGKGYLKDYRSKNPEKYRAHTELNNAIRDGHVVPLPCFICGAKAVAHHTHYSHPLEVTWLCQAHHKQAHALGEKIDKQEQARP